MTTSTDISVRSRSRGKSILRAAFDNLIEARQRQAERHMAESLAMYRRDDRNSDVRARTHG